MGACAGAARRHIHVPLELQGPPSGHPPGRCLAHPHLKEMGITGWPEIPLTPATFLIPPSLPFCPTSLWYVATLTQENDGAYTDTATD